MNTNDKAKTSLIAVSFMVSKVNLGITYGGYIYFLMSRSSRK